MSMRIISWNTRRPEPCWRALAAEDAVDIALLQEAIPPPADVIFDTIPKRPVLTERSTVRILRESALAAYWLSRITFRHLTRYYA